MTREADRRLDALLDSAPRPQVPTGLAQRIAAQVTSLPQEKQVPTPVIGEQTSLEPSAPPSRKHRGIAMAAAAAAIIGVAALSLAAGPDSQPELPQIAKAPPAAATSATEQLAVEVPPAAGPLDQQLIEAAPLPQHSAPSATKRNQDLALDTVEQPAAEVIAPEPKSGAKPGDTPPGAALATITAPTQGPEIADGVRRTATPYGPPAGEGLGITGATLPRGGRPPTGGSPMPPMGPPPGH